MVIPIIIVTNFIIVIRYVFEMVISSKNNKQEFQNMI